MTVHRVTFRVRLLMLIVAGCAESLALLQVDGHLGPLLIILGPVMGSCADRALGGGGLLGGILCGFTAFCGFGALMYMRAYFYPQPNTVDYLGPILSFSVLAFFGAIVGFAVGGFIWCLNYLDQTSKTAPESHDR
jgi:hypothetical protein